MRWLLTYILLALAIAISLLSGCAPKETSKVTLKIALASESHREFLKPLVDIYSYKHKNVDFEINNYGYIGLYKAMLEDLRQGTWKFDVVFVDDPWVAGLYKRGYLLDLTEEFGWKPDRDIMPIFASSPEVNGHYLAMPVIGNIQIFVIRKDLVQDYCESVPDTWEEVLNCARRVYNPEKNLFGYIQRTFSRPQEGNYNPILTDWLPMYYAYGGYFKLDERGYISEVNTEALVESCRLLKDLMETSFGGLSTIDHNEHDRIITLLGGKFQAQTAMGLIWPMGWALKLTSKEYVKNPNDILFTPLPSGPKGRFTILGTWNVGIPITSQHPKEAFQFISWLSSQEVQKYYGSYGGVPTRRSALEDPGMIMTYPFYGVILDSLRYVKKRPKTPYWVIYEREFGKLLRNYLKGKLTEDDLKRGFQEVIEKIKESK